MERPQNPLVSLSAIFLFSFRRNSNCSWSKGCGLVWIYRKSWQVHSSLWNKLCFSDRGIPSQLGEGNTHWEVVQQARSSTAPWRLISAWRHPTVRLWFPTISPLSPWIVTLQNGRIQMFGLRVKTEVYSDYFKTQKNVWWWLLSARISQVCREAVFHLSVGKRCSY